MLGRGISRGGVSVSSGGLWGVDSSTFIGDRSNESVVVVSGVGGGLDSAIGKSNGERSSNLALGILSLALLEVSLRVVIGYSVLISIWLRGELHNWGSVVSRGRVVWGGGAIGWGAISAGNGEKSGGNEELVHDPC